MTLPKEIDDLEKFIKNIKPSFLYLFLGEMLIIAFSCLFFGCIEKSFVLNFELKSLVIFCFVFLYFLYWCYKRKLPKFSEDENGILFAFNKIDTKTKEELDILYKKVISNIKEEKLESKIEMKTLPEHISILNLERSKEIREKYRAKVVIWGDVEAGTVNSQNKKLIIPIIRFTYETRIKEKKRQFFNQNISNIILNKPWMVDEKEQVIERDYLSRNIEKISLYLIGWTLILSNLENDRNDGNKILQQILKDYKKRNNLNNDEKLMVSNIEIQLTLYYNGKARDMNFRFTDKLNKETIQKGRKLLMEIENSGINENRFLLFEAILDFLENEKDASFEKVKKAVELSDGKDSASFYSLAFLNYHYGDLNNGFKYLKKALKLATPVDQMSSIVGWYEEALSENNDKKYLNFPIGQIYYNLLESADPQREIARESLDQFASDYKDNKNEIILEMVDEADKMLKKISAKTNS